MDNKYLLILLLLFIQRGAAQENVFEVARKGTLEQAQALMATDPDVFDTVNEAGYSPLILACYRGNNEVAKFIIESGVDINGSSSMGTPLMAAVVKGNIEIVKALLEKKADVNFADANGTTALIYSVKFQNAPILSLLLDHKADKTHKDNDGKTAFEHAVFAGNETIINLLK